MERNSPNRSLAVLTAILCAVSGLAVASYQTSVVLKHSVGTEHADTFGNTVYDSLARHMSFVATLYRAGMTDSVTAAATTNDAGVSVIRFDRWPESSTPIDSPSITRLDMSFPNALRAIKTGGRYHFKPGDFGDTLLNCLPSRRVCFGHAENSSCRRGGDAAPCHPARQQPLRRVL